MMKILVASSLDEDRNRILTVLTGQKDLYIAGVEKDAIGAIIKSESLKPDVLIMDLQTPWISGPELAPIIRRRSPATAIIMICDRDDDDYAGRALKAGISGFMLKKTDMDKLIPIVKIVFSGGYYISASITDRVFGAITFMNKFPAQAIEHSKLWINHKHNSPYFSPAERGIVTHLAQGLSDKEIAKYLHFNIGTIRNYMMDLKRKTKLKNRVQIAIYSLFYGIIDFEQTGIIKNNRQNSQDRIQ